MYICQLKFISGIYYDLTKISIVFSKLCFFGEEVKWSLLRPSLIGEDIRYMISIRLWEDKNIDWMMCVDSHIPVAMKPDRLARIMNLDGLIKKSQDGQTYWGIWLTLRRPDWEVCRDTGLGDNRNIVEKIEGPPAYW